MFLDYPTRKNKPRTIGLTCVIDTGLPLALFVDTIESFAPSIDYVKFGWGTGIITACIADKIKVLRQHQIEFWFGGTLFEISYAQGKLEQYINWLNDYETNYIELSNATLNIPNNVMCSLIRDLSKEFKVLSEVGGKNIKNVMPASQWVSQIRAEIEAGAWKVITEGREGGNAGIYRENGEIRIDIIQEIKHSEIDINRLIFEAPQKAQQIWFIKHLGYNTNFANVHMEDILNLETLRLGLRSDTFLSCSKSTKV
jgi:phosphosulfolactate synthase